MSEAIPPSTMADSAEAAAAIHPSPFSNSNDFWASLPVSLLGYAHVLGEVAAPIAPKWVVRVPAFCGHQNLKAEMGRNGRMRIR